MSAPIGHNSQLGEAKTGALKSYVRRLQTLDEDRAAIRADEKEVYSEAKLKGFEAKIIRKCLRLLKMQPEKRQEEQDLIDLYMAAVGEQMDLFEREDEAPAPPAPAPEKPVTRPAKSAARVAIEADEEAAYQRLVPQITGRSNVTAAMLHNQFKVPFDQAKRFLERLVREEIIPGEPA